MDEIISHCTSTEIYNAGLHMDRVFLKGAADRFLTAWLPLQAVSPHEGGMLVCRGSHRYSCTP